MPEIMIEKNQVDVVILSWNRIENTIATIESVLLQKGIKAQTWLIDQGSDTDTIRILQDYVSKHPSLRLIELNHNCGVAVGRNIGMKLGKEEFIICIDNDAVFENNTAIKKTLEKFRLDDDLAVIGYRIKNHFTGITDSQNWVYARQLKRIEDNEFLATRYCGAGHAIRRSALEKTSYYDEKLFFYWEELDLSYKLINLGFKIIYFPEVTIRHKVDPDERLNWKGNRYYFLMRNAIYLDWKYYRKFNRIVLISLGYIVKGFFNGHLVQTTRALFDSGRMLFSLKSDTNSLDKVAQEYIFQNDIKFRGSFFERFKLEVLEKLN